MPTLIRRNPARASTKISFNAFQTLLLAQRRGFALYGNVTGGYGATSPTIVTNTNASGAGSLRAALVTGSSTPRWVIFDRNVFPRGTQTIINLAGTSPIDMRNDTNVSIDGRGAFVNLRGYGITTATWTGSAPNWATGISNNLIFNNFKISNIASGNYDCMTMDGTDRAWLHHMEMTDGGDGNLDITLTGQGPNANGFMTVSNSQFWGTQSTKNCLFGDQTEFDSSVPAVGYGDHASSTSSYPFAEGGDNRITSVDNWFHDVQRNPIAYNYWLHHINDYFSGWTLEGPAAMGGMAQLIGEWCALDGTGAGANASKGFFTWTYPYADTTRKYKRTSYHDNWHAGGSTELDSTDGFTNPSGSIYTLPYTITPQMDSSALLIARLTNASRSIQGRAGTIDCDGYYDLVV